MSACLHTETSVMNPEYEICTLAVTTLTHLPVGLVRRRSADVAVQAKLNGHPGSLLTKCEELSDTRRS